MRKMKNSGIEWIGNIPDNWKVKKLKYIANKIERGTSPNYTDAIATKVVNQATFSKGYFDSSNIKYSTIPAKQSKGLLVKGDVLLASTGGGVLGKTFYFNQNNTFVADGHVTIVRTNVTNCVSKFIYYIFSINYDNFNVLMARGSTNQIELQRSILSNMQLPVPPIEEQKKIVEFLDEKCGEIDALIADIKIQIESLEQYKRSVITEAVTKGLNPFAKMKDSGIEWLGCQPSNWEHVKGKYLFVQRNDRGNNVELQLLSPTQNYGVIPQSKYEELSGMSAVKLNEKINLQALKTIHKGDFCISLRSFQGGFEYSEYEGVVSPAYQVFYAVVPIYNNFYKYLFKEKSFIEVMNSYTISLRDGKNIAFSDFGNTYLPYPPIEEQKQIADYLDNKCAQIEELKTAKQSQIETLEAYKRSIIYEYVTGKKEVV